MVDWRSLVERLTMDGTAVINMSDGGGYEQFCVHCGAGTDDHEDVSPLVHKSECPYIEGRLALQGGL